jgi:hypothetical protein
VLAEAVTATVPAVPPKVIPELLVRLKMAVVDAVDFLTCIAAV